MLGYFVSQLRAANFTSSQTGNWNSSSTWGVGLPDFVLPIELFDFQAIDKTKSVQLTWQTTKEINASHFDIERSTNSKTFEKIWETKAKGASATYNFDDNTPSVI